jgi:hypothetical protein
VVNLKDAEAWVRVAVGEGVEARAEQDVLGGVEGVEGVFGVEAAGDEEGPQADGVGAVRALRGAAEFFGVGGAEDADGERVLEDDR